MASESNVPAHDEALTPMAPGPLLGLANGALEVVLAPAAGGRVAQIRYGGLDWLVNHDEQTQAMIAWGSYPMLPWAGRVRGGRFPWHGEARALPANLGGHAIHGVGFALPWQVGAHSPDRAELTLELPRDERWPFGGQARQRIEVGERELRMELTLTADASDMPAVIGWHPWFRKPDRLEFEPGRCYPRDADGIAHLPLVEPPPSPWDDCFINDRPVILHRGGRRIRLTSNCSHWVVYDETSHATCVEPQTGPPDAFNLGLATPLARGATLSAWFRIEWI
ncbi:aldose epimerase [Dyella jiangningensis]|uniref:aldose epimerase family protein n=1 Tax=Dyella jiangningensis TaxID=1379159 RepID=UPI00240EA2B0|nr:aldose epimerase [Dyella jiangningensis]MDG2538581.1 aldose epimerase [Dyella jiangningensis]